MVLSALLGLLSGLGEALIDLATPPFSPPDVLYVTVVANLLLFLLVGLLFWVLGLGLRSPLAYSLALFILVWALLRGWQSELAPRATRDFVWLSSTVGTCLLAAPLSIWARKYTLKARRIAGQTLPWVAGMVLVTIVAIPMYRAEARHRAMKFAPRAPGNLPNVLLIVVDAMRADHLSCYGYERSTSPNFDQLAARGVLFENAIATSSWTLPSHASMFTGLYPKQHHAQRFQDSLGAAFPTLAKELERLGYRTGAFSGSPFFTPRQGLGQGFMEFGDFSVSPTQAFLQAHDISSILRQLGKTEWVDKNIGHPSAVDINESVVHWVDRIHAPFFVTVNYYEVHQPSSLPRSWRHHFSTGQRSANVTSSEATPSQVIPSVQSKIDGYDGAIAYDDDSLQKLIGELARRHLMNNTLLILTADHGEGLGEHGLWNHGTALYYPLIHVPLIFYWPARLPFGVRVTQPVSTKEIPATIMEVLSASHGQMPGRALSSLWNGQTPPDQWPMPVSELVRDKQHFGQLPDDQGETESIISSKFQFIFDLSGGSSLYNWQEDPQERENLFLSAGYKAIATELAIELKGNLGHAGNSR